MWSDGKSGLAGPSVSQGTPKPLGANGAMSGTLAEALAQMRMGRTGAPAFDPAMHGAVMDDAVAQASAPFPGLGQMLRGGGSGRTGKPGGARNNRQFGEYLQQPGATLEGWFNTKRNMP